MLKEQLLQDLKQSMKEKQTIRKNVIQMVRAAILQKEKDEKVELTEEQILAVMAKEVKKRKDSLQDYEKSGREELIHNIQEEILVLQEYLQKPLSIEEIEQQVQQMIQDVGATSIKDMGVVMKVAKETIGSRADGKQISQIVKKLLG